MRSFVIGNGLSRMNLNLKDLKNKGTTYGCNALYRDFEPDYLIAVDVKMIVEIEKSGYQKTHSVWTNPNAKYRSFEGFNYFTPSLGWSSGPTALWLASYHQPSEIYIFGFDFVGINGKFNNIYADSENYKRSFEMATYYGNWEKQTENVVRKNPHIKYFRVIAEPFYAPQWKYENFRHITYTDFAKLLGRW